MFIQLKKTQPKLKKKKNPLRKKQKPLKRKKTKERLIKLNLHFLDGANHLQLQLQFLSQQRVGALMKKKVSFS